MLDVHLYVHGRGRGHASRAIHLVAALHARGHRVRAFAGRDAVEVLRPHVDTTPITSLPARLDVSCIATLRRRMIDDLARNRATRPHVVVSDGDLPGICAARLAGIPSIALGHGLVFLACERPRGVPRLPWWREALKAGVASIGARRRIATHFAVLPLRRRDTIVARPPMREWLLQRAPDRVVAYFRDGVAAEQLAALRSVDPDAIVFAPGGGAGVLAPTSSGFDAVIARARAVVASAGSQLIAECAAHGIPLLALYREDDDEQRLNATMLADAGLGLAAPMDALSPALLAELLSPTRRRGAAALPACDSTAAVVDACESLARTP